MYVVGLSSYSHESSCSLIEDGKIIAVLEEERLNREKHTSRYPQHAIAACLVLRGLKPEDIAHWTFFWQPDRELWGNIAHFLRYFPRTLNLLKADPGTEELPFLRRVLAKRNVGKALQSQFSLKQAPKVHFIEHHLCHAASAFFVSEFKEAAILTLDGRGESTSTMLAAGRDTRIEKLMEIKVPHSLGHLYAAVTDHLGFKPFFDEWKVMGMSAYGKDTYTGIFDDILQLPDNGTYRLNLKYFNFHTAGKRSWVSDYFLKKLGPKRNAAAEYEQRHFDTAFALQRSIEKAGVHLAKHLYKLTGLPNLCMTGGVALNCLMNKRIVEESPFKNFFIQPIANDAGTSLGSALYYYHQVLGKERTEKFGSIYLGLEYDNVTIEKALNDSGVKYHRSGHIAQETAQYIAQGKIVGWFQGRMEAGPRALGNRSIVVTPTDAAMKERLNARVKKREYFRPFAPSVLEEKAAEYFLMPKEQSSPYMILVGDVREDKKKVIPAVVHADGTARVHTVSQRTNPRYWQLIAEFEKITGVPVLLNTSFNENEPIVSTPEDAVNCFLRTEFDVLAIGDFLATKGRVV